MPVPPILASLGRRLGRWLKDNPEAEARIWLWIEQTGGGQLEGHSVASLVQSFVNVVMPPNWAGLSVDLAERAKQVMLNSGLCLIWVPRAEIVQAIVTTSSKESRDGVLLRHTDSIVEDIESVLKEVTHPQLGELPCAIAEAVDAFHDGYTKASQALSAAALTGMVQDHYGFKKLSDARDAFEAEPPHSADSWYFRRSAIQWLVRDAILKSEDLPASSGFNRNLSVHRVDSEQCTKANALAALMLVTGALRELQEIYLIGERGIAVTPRLKQLAESSQRKPDASRG